MRVSCRPVFGKTGVGTLTKRGEYETAIANFYVFIFDSGCILSGSVE